MSVSHRHMRLSACLVMLLLLALFVYDCRLFGAILVLLRHHMQLGLIALCADVHLYTWRVLFGCFSPTKHLNVFRCVYAYVFALLRLSSTIKQATGASMFA